MSLWKRIKEWWAKLTKPVVVPPVTPPVADTAYVVRRGERVEREMTVPFTLSFRVAGVERFSGRDTTPDTTNNPDTAMLAWAYSPAWEGGKKPFVVHLRTYKLITNDGTVRERPLPEGYDPSRTYAVALSVGSTETTATITDEAAGTKWIASCAFAAPAKMTVGYGWPVSSRPGVLGMRVMDVKWGA